MIGGLKSRFANWLRMSDPERDVLGGAAFFALPAFIFFMILGTSHMYGQNLFQNPGIMIFSIFLGLCLCSALLMMFRPLIKIIYNSFAIVKVE